VVVVEEGRDWSVVGKKVEIFMVDSKSCSFVPPFVLKISPTHGSWYGCDGC
jgi:hypothetical protein